MFKKCWICTFLIIYSFAFGYSDQVVVSQFDNFLKSSEKYKLEEKQSDKTYKNYPIQSGEQIKSITIKGKLGAEGALDDSINFDYVDSSKFTYSSGNYSYAGDKKAIMIPFDKASDKSLRFSLTETYTNPNNEDITTHLVEEIFSLPVALGTLTKSETQTGGVKFTYQETQETRKKHLENYKKQEMMIRISKKGSNCKYDIMGMKNPYKLGTIKGNADDFFNGNSSYMDFWVNGENFYGEQNIKAQNTAGNIETELRYIPGHIELFGLPNGDYNIEIYTFRYTKDTTSRGSLIVTRENDTNFSVNKSLKTNAVEVLSFSTEEFPKLKAKILTVSDSATVSLKMQEAYDSGAFADSYTFNNPTPLTEVYIDGVKTPLVNGKDVATGFYYYQWDIEKDSKYTSIDDKGRKVKFILLDGSTEKASAQAEYVINVSTKLIEGYPHQTVYAYFPNGKDWTSPVEINDRTMNRYSKGYKSISLGSAVSLEELYSGNSTKSQDLIFNNGTYLWEGTNENKKAVIIRKVKSGAKGTLKGGSEFTYYTQDWSDPNFKYVQETNSTKNETASFTWDSPEKNSYTTVNTEKMLFRIVKGNVTTTVGNETLPNKYFSPEGNPLITGENELLEFSNGTRDYADIIFDGGGSSTKYSGKASFTYSDNSLTIRDLPRGDYTLQIYAIQGEDSQAKADTNFDYKVITYGAYKTFTIGLPEGVTGGFTNENNVYMINSINMTKGLNTETKEQFKDVTVMFTTKAQKSLLLTPDNLISRKDEAAVGLKKESTGLKVTEQKLTKNTDGTYSNKGNIENVSNLALSKGVGQLKFPLDIVIAIGSHGIGQQLIANVKTGIKNATEKFDARGYDVRFNLIYFGSPLDIKMPTTSKYHAGKIGINDTWNKKVVFDDTITYPGKSLSMIGNIDQLVAKNYTHMATFKSGKAKTGDSINDYWFTDLTELNSALDSLEATGSYPYEDINSAWAIDRASDYLKKYGRYLNSNNKAVGFSEKVEGDIPSEKMLVLLTIKDMSSLNLPQKDVDGKDTGYTKDNVVAKLSDKLSENNIKFSGIFRSGVYTDNEAKYQNKGLTYTKSNAYYVNYSDKDYGYNLEKYWIFNTPYGKFINAFNTWTGINGITDVTNIDTSKNYQIQRSEPLNAAGISNNWSTPNVSVIKGSKLSIVDKLGISGNMPYTPSGKGINLADFAIQNMGSNFSMYEAGGTSENENVDDINISRAFEDIVNNVSIIQTWKMTYRSPFNLSDGDFRETIFSLDTKNILASKYDKINKKFVDAPLVMTSKINPNSRIYYAPEIKIESYFVNPDETKKALTKKDGKIILEALSSSQYRNLTDNKLYNYPIVKGTFVITDDKGNSHTVSSETIGAEKVTIGSGEIDANKKTWYRSKSSLDLQSFYKKFGRNPKLKISFTAETNENIDTIVAEGLSLKDEDPPKITKISFSNETAKEFFGKLQIDASNPLFTNDEVSNFTWREKTEKTLDEGLKPEDLEGNYLDKTGNLVGKLNVKASDKVSIEIVIDDENIYNDKDGVHGSVILKYGANYPMTYVEEVKANDGDFATKSKWRLENFSYVKDSKKLNFVISDSSSPANTYNITPEVFAEPELIPATKFKENTTNPMGYTNYYNSSLETEKTDTEALAYITAFDWDKEHADIVSDKSYPLNGKNWTSSKKGTFPLFDGGYKSGQVYGINKAGGISVLGWTDNTLDSLVSLISGTNEFYVDTVKPEAKDIAFEKSRDNKNPELNSVKDASGVSIINGPIGEKYNRAYKEGDTIKTSGKVKDINFAKFSYGSGTDTISLFKPNFIPTLNSPDSTTKEMNYTEEGEAASLGTIPYKQPLAIKVYDKAGNVNDNFSINVLFDERETSTQKTVAKRVGDNKNFTDDTLLPLDTLAVGEAPLAVGKVGIDYFGDLRDNSNRKLGLFKNSSGESYPIFENAFNLVGDITVYSYAGVKSQSTDKGITVDTKINDDRTILIEASPTGVGSNKYKVNLNKIFSTVKELVGLNKFEILSTSVSGVSGLEINEATPSGEHLLIGAGYYLNPTASNVTAASNGIYYMTFTTALRGNIDFSIRITDRLEKSKTITYRVQIPNNVSIIGKKVGSALEINTKINANGKMKIDSRTE